MAKKATIRTRKRGKTYSYSFDAGKNPTTGKRKMIEKGGYATEQEAYDAGVAAYADWKSGNIGITSERILLRDYLTAWLENVAKPSIAQGTYINYRSVLHARIIPYLGGLVLQDVHPRDIDAWVKHLAAEGLAKRTIEVIKTILSTALKYAVYPAEIIASNPCTGISIPRSAPIKLTQRVIISPEIFATVLEKCPFGHRCHIPLLLAYHTGARIGEILGLTWDDIDLQDGVLHIRYQLATRSQQGQLYYTPPKTESSKRTILIDRVLLTALRRWKMTQAQNELYFGDAYQIIYGNGTGQLRTAPKIEAPTEDAKRLPFVCTDDFGLPVLYDAVRYVLHPFGLNAHSFRHTHATKLIEAGAKPVDVAARLGHVNPTITQNLYTHDTEEMQRETIAIFSRIVVVN